MSCSPVALLQNSMLQPIGLLGQMARVHTLEGRMTGRSAGYIMLGLRCDLV